MHVRGRPRALSLRPLTSLRAGRQKGEAVKGVRERDGVTKC
jgi:hypothetical protein